MKELEREFGGLAAAIVVLNLVLAFGAVGLFGRMTPAVDRVVGTDERGYDAARAMLVVLASREQGEDGMGEPMARQRYLEALEALEEDEASDARRAILEGLHERANGTLNGDPEATERSAGLLERLLAMERGRIEEAGTTASRMGRAGAWAAVILGLASFALVLLVLRRFRRRVLFPMKELHRVLDTPGSPGTYARCQVEAAPREVQRVLERVNHLLDLNQPFTTPEGRDADQADVARAALLTLLEDIDRPTAVLDLGGDIVAANDRALKKIREGARPDFDAMRKDLEEGEGGDDAPRRRRLAGRGELWTWKGGSATEG